MIDVRLSKRTKKGSGTTVVSRISTGGGTPGAATQAWVLAQKYLTEHQDISHLLPRATFSDLFEKVNVGTASAPVWAIKAKYHLYSVGELAAYGFSEGSGGGAVGIDETTLAKYLTDKGYATQIWVKNQGYLTSHQSLAAYLTKTDAATLYQPKGNYLTEHQSLAAYLTKTDAAATYLSKTDASTFYQPKGSYALASDLSSHTGNSTIHITAAERTAWNGKVDAVSGKGLSANDFTDALLTKLNGIAEGANKYVHPSHTAKVITAANGLVVSSITVDALGHVSAVGSKSLTASDIPMLAISKVSGLQGALDSKLSKATFEDLFEKVNVGTASAPVWAIKAKYHLYSVGELAAYGFSGGSGGGAVGIDETTLAKYLTDKGYATQIWVKGQNYLTAITKAQVEAVLTGNITTHTHSQYLTAHQSLANYYTKSEADYRYHATTDISFAGKWRSQIVTFDKSQMTGRPDGASWVNGFVSTHNGYLSSFIVNNHRTNDWWLGWFDGNNAASGNHWVKMLHEGNYASILDGRYYTESEVNTKLAGYQPKGNYVTTDTAQIISGEKTFSGGITAASFIRSGGTSAQFLKADGSVDGNSYLKTSDFVSNVLACFGWTSRATSFTWGNQTGTALSVFNDSTGGSIGFRRDNPLAGKMSAIIDGYWYQSEGKYRCIDTSDYTAADVLAKLKTVDGSGSGLDADLLDGYHRDSFEGYYRTPIDARTLDANTWYPVVFMIPRACQTRVRVEGGSTAPAAWNGRTDKGMALYLDYTVQGSDWGWVPVSRVVHFYHEGTGTSKCLRGLGQLTNFSWEYIFVRGGAFYNFYLSSNIAPALQTSTFTSQGQSVSPTTTEPAAIVRNNALISDNVASATKLQTARTIWGQSFDGSENVSGNMTGVGRISASGQIISKYAALSSKNIWVSDEGQLSVRSTKNHALGIGASEDGFGIIQTAQISVGPIPLLVNPLGGNVGIGTTSPAFKLDVNGEICARGVNAFRAAYGDYGMFLRNDGTTTYMMLTAKGDALGTWNGLRPFYINNATGNVTVGNGALQVEHGGNVTVGNNLLSKGEVTALTASDERLKTNIRPLTDALARLRALGGYKVYDYKAEAHARQRTERIGLVWQHVRGRTAELMSKVREDGYGALNYLSPDYINIIGAATLETADEVTRLRRRVAKLEKELKTLKA